MTAAVSIIMVVAIPLLTAVMSYEDGGGGTICDGGGDNGDGDIISRRR
jgi:hypothetical protein